MAEEPMAKPALSDTQVDAFLRGRFGPVRRLRALAGGMWSSAYAFECDAGPLVARFGYHREDYEKDALASGWRGPLRPIPEVLEVGAAFDGAYAVSRRVDGEAIDQLAPERLAPAIEHLFEFLAALTEVRLPGGGYGMWRAPGGDAPFARWRDFLVSVPLRDDARLHGWRDRLAAYTEERHVFEEAHVAIEAEAPSCADVRGVVHSDLLYGNVLVSAEGDLTGVFDWGNSLAGDPLYDVSWLLFWSPWHPGIDTHRVRDAAARHFRISPTDERLFVYQLHIALEGMQYQAFAGLTEHLAATARRTRDVLAARR